MPTDNIHQVTIDEVRALIPEDCSIGNDFLLFNSVRDMRIPDTFSRMNCLLLALCTHGYASYTVDTVNRRVAQGDIIIVNNGQVIGDFSLSDDCQGIAIMISEEFMQSIIAQVHELSQLFLFSRSHPVFHLQPYQQESILQYCKMIGHKVRDISHHFRRDTVRSLMTTMIYDVSNVIYHLQGEGSRRQTRGEAIFASFIQLVEQNYRHERRVGGYALQLGITPKYLSETIKAVSKRTPNDWIDNYVVMALRVQLRTSTKSIKEIAQEMHFPNQSFLGKYFKQHTGISPSQFRAG